QLHLYKGDLLFNKNILFKLIFIVFILVFFIYLFLNTSILVKHKELEGT
ncbi:unnamed protein product, partial [marine sediment metagenome]